MSFSVTILGSGAALPTLRRAPSSQFIECNNRYILIDCGEGTQMQLRKTGVKFQKITHILISHLHGDHYFGLPGLLSTMHLLGRNQGVTIYADPALEMILRSMLEYGGYKLSFDLRFVPLSFKDKNLVFEDNLIEIYSFPLRHRIPTCGFQIKEKLKEYRLDSDAIQENPLIKIEHLHRLKKGENILLENGEVLDFEDFTFPPRPSYSYTYCSDTAPFEKLPEYIAGSTLLYHEATFLSSQKDRAKATFHSTAAQAAQIAEKAGVKKLLLGHLSSRYGETESHTAEAQALFPNSEVVEDENVYFLDKI